MQPKSQGLYGFLSPSLTLCCGSFILGETCLALSPWVCSSLPEQGGVGEESLNALRFAGAAG